MTSPLSRISAGSFFTGLIFEYSSFGWPGTTATGTNSILSISPSSIAAMRTLRAKGEAGEEVSFIWGSSAVFLRHARLCAGHPRLTVLQQRRGWPGIGERKRRRPLDGY